MQASLSDHGVFCFPVLVRDGSEHILRSERIRRVINDNIMSCTNAQRRSEICSMVALSGPSERVTRVKREGECEGIGDMRSKPRKI